MKDTQLDINSLRVATPCSMGWENMAGDERKRFCAACELNVYNISEMTRTEVHALIGRSPGSICGRIYRRFDGTVITKDCPTGVRALRKRAARTAGAALSAILGLFSVGVAQTTEQKDGAAKPVSEAELKSEKKLLSPDKRILAGTVTDLEGNFIAGADIMIYPKDSGGSDLKNIINAKTDGGGKYIFDGLAANTYLIEANLQGYAHSEIAEITIADGEQITLDIKLTKYVAITGLVNIIVPPPPSVPGRTVITREMLDRMPKRNLF
ncbi:MAG TPA: carboxypeptidase-like regulatory domain-containing protein [Pyrinomonadaceae bacterium]|jgi:hypothetical protein|nr:carboxypeptidase-like regulatory domain-containing protein [Pyrinomonadaceae bacterium]